MEHQRICGSRVMYDVHKRIGIARPLPNRRIGRLLSAVQGLSEKKVVLVAGGPADSDAVGSVIALAALLPRVQIATVTPTIAVEKLLAELGIGSIPIFETLNPNDYEGLVITDTPTRMLVRGIDRWPQPDIVIDHHMSTTRRDLTGKVTFVDTNMPSTCSILALAIPDDLLTRQMALALASGHIVDSGNVTRGGASSHMVFAHLATQSGMTQDEIFQLSFGEMDPEIRRSILTSMGAETNIVRGHVLARFSVPPDVLATRELAAIIADLLIGGSTHAVPTADIILCTVPLDNQEPTVQYSLRASTTASHGLNLSNVAKRLSRMFGGNGGGHKRLAGGSVAADTDLHELTRAFERIVDRQLASV